MRQVHHRVALRGFAAFGAALVVAAVSAGLSWAVPAYAAGTERYVATTGSDAGEVVNDCLDPAAPCLTIQHAVDEANAGDTVSIAAGTYTESVVVSNSLTLAGAGSTGVDKTTVAGSGTGDPGIRIDGVAAGSPPVVTIENLDISNVDDSGIEIINSVVTLQNSSVTGNSDDGISVSGANGGSPPDLTVTDSVIEGNDDEGINIDDGAIASITHSTINGNGDGGVIVEEGSASISASTLDSNVGAGVVSDGAGTSTAVTDSTISNTRPFSDGADGDFGGGVLVFPGGTTTIATSTLTGNTGQGVLVIGGTAAVTNSTITGTKPGTGSDLASGAVDNDTTAGNAGGSLSLSGTILADNTAPNCSGTVTDSGYNLSDTAVCAFSAAGSINQGAAMLNGLADNGGPTLTQLPAEGSDAIDQIPSGSAGCASTGTDQRGDSRLQGSLCDIGAVEVAHAPLVVPTLANTGVPVPLVGSLGAGGLATLLGAVLLLSVASRRRTAGAVANRMEHTSR